MTRVVSYGDVGKGCAQAFRGAVRDFAPFRGRTEAEWLAWLPRILVCNLARLAQQLGTQKRDARREVSLDHYLRTFDRQHGRIKCRSRA
jgi:hypothetical protein